VEVNAAVTDRFDDLKGSFETTYNFIRIKNWAPIPDVNLLLKGETASAADLLKLVMPEQGTRPYLIAPDDKNKFSLQAFATLGEYNQMEIKIYKILSSIRKDMDVMNRAFSQNEFASKRNDFFVLKKLYAQLRDDFSAQQRVKKTTSAGDDANTRLDTCINDCTTAVQQCLQNCQPDGSPTPSIVAFEIMLFNLKRFIKTSASGGASDFAKQTAAALNY